MINIAGNSMRGVQVPVRILTRLLTVAMVSGCAVAAGEGATAVAEDQQPSLAESYDYPNAGAIETAYHIALRKGDGHILFAPECALEPDAITIWSRTRDTPFCLRTTGLSGRVSLELPETYLIRSNSLALQASATVNGSTQTVSVNPDTWTGIGEGADPNSGPATLTEIRTTQTNPPAGPASNPAWAFVAKIDAGVRGCTGALIDSQWVLTAKECFTDVAPEKVTVTVGRTNLAGSAGIQTTVHTVIAHPDRNLALVRLRTMVSGVTPVKVATTAAKVGDLLKIAGFGRTKTEWAPDALHVTTFSAQSSTDATLAITPASPADASLCQGDLGGPALRDTNGILELIAIHHTAFQGGCLDQTETRTAATETRTDNLGTWIQQRIAPQPVDSMPSAAATTWGDTLQVFARGMPSTHAFVRAFSPASGWVAWSDLDGLVTGTPTTLQYGNMLHAFAIGASNNHLIQKSYVPGSGWTAWVDLGGTIAGTPAAINYQGNLHIFARATPNGHLVQKVFTPGVGWSDWIDHGGIIGSPTLVEYQTVLHVFATDAADGHLVEKSYIPGSGWTPWTDLGGTISGTPDAMVYQGNLHVFARATSGRLVQIFRTSGGGWSNWIDHGGIITGDPALLEYQTALHVFATGSPSNHLFQKALVPNSGWTAWVDLGGTIAGTPVAIFYQNNLHIFARGIPNNPLAHKAFVPGPGWQSWTDHGGIIG
jgi:hypothetical protein